MRLLTEKSALVEALSCMTHVGRRQTTRRFLEGLSTDELQYIAAFLGARLLDPELFLSASRRDQIARMVAQYEHNRKKVALSSVSRKSAPTACATADVTHKMILLLEYLTMNGIGDRPSAWRVEGGWA